MKLCRNTFDKARPWITFLPPVLLFLAAKYGNLPEFVTFIFLRLWLIAWVSTYLIDALLTKEVSIGWSSVSKSKNPKYYNVSLVMMTATILFMIFRTSIEHL